MVIDASARQYDVFVTAEGGSERAVATKYAFRTEQQATTMLANLGILALAPANLSICGVSVHRREEANHLKSRRGHESPAWQVDASLAGCACR